MELTEYKEFLNYKAFFEKYDIYSIPLIKTKFSEINNYSNKNFIFILLFELWIRDTTTVKIFREVGEAPPDYKIPANTREELDVNSSFKNFNIYPYGAKKSRGLDRIPVINILDVIETLSSGVGYITKDGNNKLKDYYSNIEKLLPQNATKSKIKRINIYVNKNFSNIKSADEGLYIDLIKMFSKDENKYKILVDEYDKGSTDKDIFKGLYLIKDLLDSIEKIKNINFNELNNLVECLKNENEINVISDRIISFFNLILKYIVELNKLLNKEADDTKIEINVKRKSSQQAFTVDQLIENIKPAPIPAFKKSYVVRENNLTAYIKIKILYHVSNSNFIEINNFDIPYNNILTLEHNIENQKITISLIDTEGDLSELLIYKMYQITTQVNESKKLNNVNIETALPYTLEIEYGWAGPITEDQEEMLDENIYTKKNYRGYITTISSQFTPKGSEYTLEIMPISYENNLSHANYYDFLYSNNKQTKIAFALGLFILYFILRYNKAPVNYNLKDIFSDIDNGVTVVYTDKNNCSIRFKASRFDNLLAELTTVGLNPTNDKEKIQKIQDDIRVLKELSTVIKKGDQDLKINDIKNLSNIVNIVDSTFRMNAWLVSIYFLWKANKFFLLMGKFYLLHDTTGLFDIFFQINEQFVFKFDSDLVIIAKKFNIFCFDSQKNENMNQNNFFNLIKESIVNDKFNKFNQFSLEEIFPGTISDRTQAQLTFFMTKISIIFSSLKNIGLNTNLDNNNTHQFSTGVKSNFMSYLDIDKQYFNTLETEYKRKIYAIKNNIYTDKKPTKDDNKDDREINSFNVFKGNVKNVLKGNVEINDKDTNDEFISSIEDLERKDKNKSNESYLDIFHILFLSYNLDKNKIIGNSNIGLQKKVAILAKNIMQSYSLMPSINPKTRNSNKQFFSQGNDKITKEGTGDILEFTLQEFDIAKITSLNLQSNNIKNFALNNFFNQTTVSGMYENAAKYYNSYIDINGNTDKQKILQDMSNLKVNYLRQINVKGSVTILGEPYWSNIDLTNRTIFIYLHIYYNNGSISDHTGLYTIETITQNIENNKFVTKIDVLRIPTFLDSLDNALSAKNSMMISS